MNGNVNKVTLIGNLGNDPEVRYTGSGVPVCNFRMATNERWNDKQGKRQERTEWHRIVVWGKLAEICGQYLSKGRTVHIEGTLRTRSWDDRDGNKRYTTEIHAKEVNFLGGRPQAQAQQTEAVGEVPTAEVDPSVSEEAARLFNS